MDDNLLRLDVEGMSCAACVASVERIVGSASMSARAALRPSEVTFAAILSLSGSVLCCSVITLKLVQN